MNILYAEVRSTRRGFGFAAEVHEKHAPALPQYASRGATAYALEKAAMFKDMSEECWSLAESVHKDHCRGDKEDEVTDTRRVYLPTLMQFSMDTLDHSLVGGASPLILTVVTDVSTVHRTLTPAKGGERRGGTLGDHTAGTVTS